MLARKCARFEPWSKTAECVPTEHSLQRHVLLLPKLTNDCDRAAALRDETIEVLQGVLELGGRKLREPWEGRAAAIVVLFQVHGSNVQHVALRHITPPHHGKRWRMREDVAARRGVGRARFDLAVVQPKLLDGHLRKFRRRRQGGPPRQSFGRRGVGWKCEQLVDPSCVEVVLLGAPDQDVAVAHRAAALRKVQRQRLLGDVHLDAQLIARTVVAGHADLEGIGALLLVKALFVGHGEEHGDAVDHALGVPLERPEARLHEVDALALGEAQREAAKHRPLRVQRIEPLLLAHEVLAHVAAVPKLPHRLLSVRALNGSRHGAESRLRAAEGTCAERARST
mmetsp:Transcript_68789/g.174792  ORF Transcript_68789/g.174792 Transcript_68789/m.174792 type:complete len:339 (-) Transcript_68789:2-1018(-)